jgi:hypothetical protein
MNKPLKQYGYQCGSALWVKLSEYMREDVSAEIWSIVMQDTWNELKSQFFYGLEHQLINDVKEIYFYE